jgi:hypothetical protein
MDNRNDSLRWLNAAFPIWFDFRPDSRKVPQFASDLWQ